MMHYISPTTEGEWCTLCADVATHKIGEELSYEEQMYLATLVANTGTPVMRHNFTAYVCCKCFRSIFGPAVFCPGDEN